MELISKRKMKKATPFCIDVLFSRIIKKLKPSLKKELIYSKDHLEGRHLSS
jgi:hypothetical protein